MLSFLFDCSAFEISPTVQTINEIFFPIALFIIIFWLMCEIFIADIAVDDNFTIVETQPNVNNSLKGVKTDNYKTEMELLNVDIKRQHLKISRSTFALKPMPPNYRNGLGDFQSDSEFKFAFILNKLDV